MMAVAAAPQPLVMKDVVLTIGDDQFQKHVSAVTLSPSSSVLTWQGLSADASFSTVTTSTWTCVLELAQDWGRQDSLCRYLFEHEGETVSASFRPESGRGPAFTASLVLTSGAIGGAVNNVATQSITLPVQGRPVLEPFIITPVARQEPLEVFTTFQSGHGWAPGGSYSAADMNATDLYSVGTQSASLTSNGACTLTRTGIPAFDMTGKLFRFKLHVENMDGLNNIKFRAGPSSANYYEWRLNPRNTDTQQIAVQGGEWIELTAQYSEAYKGVGSCVLVNGNPPITTGFTWMQFEFSNDADGPTTIHFQAVEILADNQETYPNGVVSLTFDDIWGSQTLALPKLEQLGFAASQYVISDLVDTAGRLTKDLLTSLQNNSGWEIAGHAYTAAMHDARYNTFTAAEIDAELKSLRQWLVDNKFQGETFAYPGGEFARTTDGVIVGDLVKEYFNSGRTILFSTGVPDHVAMDTTPPAMPYRMRAVTGISESKPAGSPDNPATLYAPGRELDRIVDNGGWLVLTFHELVSGTSTNGISIGVAAFEQLMDEIAARGMAVRTVGQVLGSQS